MRVAGSPVRFAAGFGGAIVLAQLGQLAWLFAASRSLSASALGTVLAAQVVYGILQIVVDVGPSMHGARLAATATLDEPAWGGIVRLRLQLASGAAAVAIAIALLGGVGSLAASLPFAAALLLFALVNYWQQFGAGDGTPWSAYLVLRTWLPALCAVAFLWSGRKLPLPAAGLAECGALLSVAIAFRLAPLAALRSALRARATPLRAAARIGVPAVFAQAASGVGVVILNAVGAGAAAAALAVAVRLVSGVNQFTAVVATAIFPGLARDRRADADADTLVPAFAALLAIVTGVSAIFLFDPAFFVRVLLDRADTDSVVAAIVTLSSSGATGYVMIVTVVLVARHREQVLRGPYTACLTLVAGGTLVAASVTLAHEAVWGAAAFALGQSVGALLLCRRATSCLPRVRRALVSAAAAVCALAAVGAFAAAVPPSRPAVSALLALVAAAATGWLAVRLALRDQAGRAVPSPSGPRT